MAKPKSTWNDVARHISIALLLVLFVLVALSKLIFIRIGPGERGVLYRLTTGTELGVVYGEGLHVISPVNTMFIYNTRYQVIDQEINVLSRGGLKVDLDLAIRFRPLIDSLASIHATLGPAYPETVVAPEVISSLRKVLGMYTQEELYYTSREEIEHRVALDLRSEMQQHDIMIDDILIRDIRLPEAIREAIEQKLVEEQNYLKYEYVLKREENEAERKRIEAEGIQVFQRTSGISILQWRGIEATLELAKSNNAKIIIMGNGEGQLPVILNPGN